MLIGTFDVSIYDLARLRTSNMFIFLFLKFYLCTCLFFHSKAKKTFVSKVLYRLFYFILKAPFQAKFLLFKPCFAIYLSFFLISMSLPSLLLPFSNSSYFPSLMSLPPITYHHICLHTQHLPIFTPLYNLPFCQTHTSTHTQSHSGFRHSARNLELGMRFRTPTLTPYTLCKHNK
jgi:hypothetical protein